MKTRGEHILILQGDQAAMQGGIVQRLEAQLSAQKSTIQGLQGTVQDLHKEVTRQLAQVSSLVLSFHSGFRL